MSFMDWYRGLWGDEEGDAPTAIAQAESHLGISFPPLLKTFYRETALRGANEIHIKELDKVEVDGGVLVFAHEQQACWSWGIQLKDLAHPDPDIVSNESGKWVKEGCRLEEFLVVSAQLARLCDPPYAEGYGDPDLLNGEWRKIRAPWKSFHLMSGYAFTNDLAVYNAEDGLLAARDVETLRAAAKRLGMDIETLEIIEPDQAT